MAVAVQRPDGRSVGKRREGTHSAPCGSLNNYVHARLGGSVGAHIKGVFRVYLFKRRRSGKAIDRSVDRPRGTIIGFNACTHIQWTAKTIQTIV